MKKLHQALFSLLLILLPIQLGRHFWPDFSLISGIRVDYLSPTIYLTDLLVIGILGVWFWERRSQLSVFSFQSLVKKYRWIIAVFCLLFVNAFLAQNQGAAFYKLIKIIEFTLLGFYVAKNNYTPFAIAKRQALLIRRTLSLAVIYSSFIAIAQLLKQASLDGVFWWLGERTFNAFTPGIARAVWDGQLIMRPYATFSHPNVLAGFILVSLTLIAMNRTKETWQRIVKWLVVILGTITILISLSRAVWLVGVLVCFWLIIRHLRLTKPDKKIFYSVLCCLLFVLGAIFYSALHLSAEEAISQRIRLAQTSIEMIKQNPLAGVGLNNFVVRLSEYWPIEAVRFLQPVHNIFLLVAAETGLIGLLIFLWFLYLTFKRLITYHLLRSSKLRLSLITSLTAILLLGLFDHYFFTLQQTQLLFTIVLGLSWANH